MKKSFPVHIRGRIYYFDEDAYERLNNYYDNLTRAFPGEDGKEIVSDIKTRVSELFSESHVDEPFAVITIEEVNEVITRMGKPEDIADAPSEPSGCKEPEETSTGGATPPPFNGYVGVPPVPQRRLYRDGNNKVIAGVISGLAIYWGVNITALRVAAVLLAIFTYLWPLVVLYILGWLLIPVAETPRQILEMRGQQVTVDSVGQTTIFGAPNPNGDYVASQNFWGSVGRVVGIVVMSFVGLIGIGLGIAGLVLMAVSLAGFLSYVGWGSYGLISYVNTPLLNLTAVLVLGVTLLIPAIGAVWATCCTLFRVKGANRRTALTLACVEFALIIASITLFAVLKDANVHFHL
ncbi:MAG: PspC domain-containing protein [Muribaculaceae bacterium]|nr:PspC domain-containing protein [Muribaculaceae bacterium]